MMLKAGNVGPVGLYCIGAFIALLMVGMIPLPHSHAARSAPDTDGDGIPDVWEELNGLNATDPTDASKDYDGDGLSNLEEYLAGWDDDGDGVNDWTPDPFLNDTDGDGMDDHFEVEYHLNATSNVDADLDIDNDGLKNRDEYLHNTSPILNDTDGDGMDDYFEVLFHLDPLSNDSSFDPDGDGYTNLEEYHRWLKGEDMNPQTSNYVPDIKKPSSTPPMTLEYYSVLALVGLVIVMIILFMFMGGDEEEEGGNGSGKKAGAEKEQKTVKKGRGKG